jgi:hypothetical protein
MAHRFAVPTVDALVSLRILRLIARPPGRYACLRRIRSAVVNRGCQSLTTPATTAAAFWPLIQAPANVPA